MTGIVLFLNDTERDYNCKIKCNVTDFVVQEVTNDKICGINHIFNIEKYMDSIDLIYYISKNKDFNCIEISKILKLDESPDELNNYKSSFEEFLTKTNIEGYEKIIESINVKRIEDTKKKQMYLNDLEEITVEISCKVKRSEIYKILYYNPFWSAQTKENNLIIKKESSDASTFTVTLEKVMYNTVNACKYISNQIGTHHSNINFAGNKDKRGITFQEISILGSFMNLFDLAYQNEDRISSKYNEILFSDKISNFNDKSNLKEVKISKKQNILNRLVLFYINDIKINDDEKAILNEDISTLYDDTECTKYNISGDDYTSKKHIKSTIKIYDIKRSSSKKLGDLLGNKFTIKIYNANNLNLEVLKNGFINYFGPQRFGKSLNNHIVGEEILNKRYTEAIESILKNSKSYNLYREIMDTYKNLDCKENNDGSSIEDRIEKCLSLCDNSERYLMKQKFKKISDKKIILGLKREIRMLYLHALQSYKFNIAVNERLKKGFEIKEGDLVEDNGIKEVTKDNMHKYNIYDLILPLEKMKDKMLKGGVRKVIETCYNITGKNEDNDFIISFMLNKSCYATVALRELVGDSILLY